MSWYLRALKKYAVFTGRASRKEFWYFLIFNIVISVMIAVIDGIINAAINDTLTSTNVTFSVETGTGVLSKFYSWAVLIPSLAVSVRRLHDIGRTGWWLLIAPVPLIGIIVLVVFMMKNSIPGDNRFGKELSVEELSDGIALK